MDYAAMLLDHVNMGARVTVACIEVPRDEASAFGVMAVDGDRKINAFVEKPANPPAMPGKPDTALASMGSTSSRPTTSTSCWKRISPTRPPPRFRHGRDPRVVQGHRPPFSMSCVGCCPQKRPLLARRGHGGFVLGSQHGSRLRHPGLDIYDQDWPIWTSQNMTPPAKFVQDRNGQHGMTINSMFAGGTIVSGSFIVSSVLFTNVRVDSFCTWIRL